jgi:hypothetical protein
MPRAPVRAAIAVLAAGVLAAGLAVAQSLPPPSLVTKLHRVILVGPSRLVRTAAEASRLARDGDTVEFDAGQYLADVAVWPQSRLTLRGLSGGARFVANGALAEGKAIWVIKGTDVVVENVAFEGARSPDENGAGIRFEGGALTVRDCRFERNEMGLMTSNTAASEVTVERSEFDHNAVARPYEDGDLPGHQIYVGTIARFTLRESYLHHGMYGHLVKTRARENRILYNRITDEPGGRASYEVEIANGGVAWVMGNLIEQSATTDNPTMVSFGAEGFRWPDNALYLASNTLVDDLPGARNVLYVRPGTPHVVLANNLLLGPARLGAPGAREVANFTASAADVANAEGFDYRLRETSRQVNGGQDPGVADGALRPTREYVHPRGSAPVSPRPFNPGAFQSLAR